MPGPFLNQLKRRVTISTHTWQICQDVVNCLSAQADVLGATSANSAERKRSVEWHHDWWTLVTPVHVVGYGLTVVLLTVAILAAVVPSIKRSRRSRKLASTFLAAAVLLGAPQAAFADSKTVGGYVYQSGMDCAWVRGTIDNSARPRMDSAASVNWFGTPGGNPTNCWNTAHTLLPGNIAVRQDLAYWNGSAWIWCNNGPFVYNQTTSHSSSTGFGWGSPPCGVGYYYNSPGAWTNNGGWHGGFTFTGYIWVS